MTFTEFPLGLSERVFGSPMPFGTYDKDGELFHELKRQDISVVVVLAEDGECLEQAQRNLPALYSTQGGVYGERAGRALSCTTGSRVGVGEGRFSLTSTACGVISRIEVRLWAAECSCP